jgi:hypothetical protein
MKVDLLVDTVPALLVVGVLALWLDTLRQHRRTAEDLNRAKHALAKSRLQRWTKDR